MKGIPQSFGEAQPSKLWWSSAEILFEESDKNRRKAWSQKIGNREDNIRKLNVWALFMWGTDNWLWYFNLVLLGISEFNPRRVFIVLFSTLDCEIFCLFSTVLIIIVMRINIYNNTSIILHLIEIVLCDLNRRENWFNQP